MFSLMLCSRNSFVLNLTSLVVNKFSQGSNCFLKIFDLSIRRIKFLGAGHTRANILFCISSIYVNK